MHLAIQIADSQFLNFEKVGESQLIADFASANWLVLGPSIDSSWRDMSIDKIAVKVCKSNQLVARVKDLM